MLRNILKASPIIISILALSACAKKSEKIEQNSDASASSVVASEATPTSSTEKSTIIQDKNEQATAQVLAEYKKEQEDKKYKHYVESIIYAIDDLKVLDNEINRTAGTQDLFQVTEIKDLKFLNGTKKSATYNIKVGVIRGGHVTSSCTVQGTYDDSIGQIEWKIPDTCHDF